MRLTGFLKLGGGESKTLTCSGDDKGRSGHLISQFLPFCCCWKLVFSPYLYLVSHVFFSASLPDSLSLLSRHYMFSGHELSVSHLVYISEIRKINCTCYIIYDAILVDMLPFVPNAF